MSQASNQELMARAMRAYFIAARKEAGTPQQPANDSGVEKHGGKRYVVLRNIKGTLAVYRVRNDGVLKSLKRWPKSLSGE
jgi:hypothetical protein